MKIDVRHLRAPLPVKITGQEDWLKSIYGLYEQMIEPITGELTVAPLDEYDRCEVKVHIAATPGLVCGQCSETIANPIAVTQTVTFFDREDPLTGQKEVTLETGDLDLYYLEAGLLDVESFINEIISLEIPVQIQHEDPQHPCTQDRLLRGEGAVYSDSPVESENPFAVLKNLKN